MIASILPMIFINSIVDNIDTIDDVTYSNTYMLGSIWYDVDIDYITSMIPSTNSIDELLSIKFIVLSGPSIHFYYGYIA